MSEGLVETIARAVANDLIVQDGFADPSATMPLVWDWIDQGRTHFCVTAKSIITALTEAGYAIVPIEPTPDMVEAGWLVVSCDHPSQSDLERGTEAACWSAMIKASPTLDSEEGV